MTDLPRFLPALSVLTALSALALPAQVHAMPSGPAVTAPQRAASVLDVADRRHPHRNVDRNNDQGNATGDAQVDQLNQASLQRAQQGQNSPSAGPDTPPNLNSMSERDAARGRNTGGQPLKPFR